MAVSRHDATLFTCGNSYTTSVDATATRASPWGVFVVSFEEEPLMSHSPASTGVPNLGAEVEDDFVLDVKVVLDDATRPAGQQTCDTSNGCPSTCESSCNSAM